MTDDTASISLEFGDGSIGSIHYFANGAKEFPKERVEVFCDGAVLVLDNFVRLTALRMARLQPAAAAEAGQGTGRLHHRRSSMPCAGPASPIPLDELIEVSRVSIRLAEAQREASPDARQVTPCLTAASAGSEAVAPRRPSAHVAEAGLSPTCCASRSTGSRLNWACIVVCYPSEPVTAAPSGSVPPQGRVAPPRAAPTIDTFSLEPDSIRSWFVLLVRSRDVGFPPDWLRDFEGPSAASLDPVSEFASGTSSWFGNRPASMFFPFWRQP